MNKKKAKTALRIMQDHFQNSRSNKIQERYLQQST